MTAPRQMSVAIEEWPLVKPFRISRGADASVVVVVVEVREGSAVGRGEATPYARYDETPSGVKADIEAVRERVESGAGADARALGLRGAAANALDCALVDLEAKLAGTSAWRWLGEAAPQPLVTTMTVTLDDDPEAMAREALKYSSYGLLKLKLGAADGDVERVRAVRKARPDARLICDVNEGWSAERLQAYAPELHALGVLMIEQPCPAGDDGALAGLRLPIPLCADESCHVAADVEGLAGRYDLVNVKLDKAGGLRGALELVEAARAHGMDVMVGCMLGTSLAMAPGVIAGQHAVYVDLDAPLSLTRDRAHGLAYRDGVVGLPAPELWG